MTKQWKRRSFLSTAGRAAAGLVILPNSRSVWGYPANERLNIAAVGVGGMGTWNLANFAGRTWSTRRVCESSRRHNRR